MLRALLEGIEPPSKPVRGGLLAIELQEQWILEGALLYGLVLEAGEELHPTRVDDRWPPGHPAVLARMGVVRLGGELTNVHVPFPAFGAPQQHWKGDSE